MAEAAAGGDDARRADDRPRDSLTRSGDTMAFRPIVLTVAADAAAPFERHGEPVSIGVAGPRGAAARSTRWALTDQRGRNMPVQTTVLDRWGDASVRWLLAEFQADVDAGQPSYYALAPDDGSAAAAGGISIEHAGDTLRVWTGAATIDVPRSGTAFISNAEVGGRALLQSTAIVAEDQHGSTYQFAIQRTLIERAGTVRAVIRLDGHFVDRLRRRWLDASMRLHLFAGMGTVKIDFSVTNPRAARHPGGAWDLGDAGSVLIRDLSIRIVPAKGAADVWGSLDAGDQMGPAGARFAVHQESSGGAEWQHVNHATRHNTVAPRFRGFRAVRDGREVEGLRATPIVSIGGGDTRVSVAMPRFWEIFPKAIEADTKHCALAMFPRASGLHELQGGERASMQFAISFGRDTVSAEPLAWVRSPLRVSADPLAYRQAGAWAPLGAGSARAAQGYEALVNTAIRGPESFFERRETIDEYGWRNFGDLYADHEGALVSHYNNQYDAVAGFLTRFLQTGDHRWWRLGDELAGHVADIDLYHTTRDRAAYNGGYFWHTQHYQPAGTATHRAYSKRSGSSGGGPCSEHNYTTGLMLHHFLTGSERSRAAVIQLANWVIDMDDGRKSRFRWIDRRDTGLASVTRSPDFHGPGRGAGNSINALLDAHRLTGEPRYLDKADALIARCVHPDDDPASIDPLDAENRWSYTVFLQALGKYLEHRADRGLVDERFEYARAVLLKWALWMAANERPYLDHPEKLEFPTETWAAQDIRKAAVFEFAARHTTDEGTRATFLARADRFVDYAVMTLIQSPTGTLTRPLVLLLAYGFQRPMGALAEPHPAASPHQFERQAFVPLRQRLKKRLALAGAGLSAVAVVVIILLVS
ncbi:MAG: glycoside hydrolase family 127 protein [Cyanobacteria bacterium]|nr:glycoside hydrolase family 127 protein [Cyanobacteriota bacterium]